MYVLSSLPQKQFSFVFARGCLTDTRQLTIHINMHTWGAIRSNCSNNNDNRRTYSDEPCCETDAGWLEPRTRISNQYSRATKDRSQGRGYLELDFSTRSFRGTEKGEHRYVKHGLINFLPTCETNIQDRSFEWKHLGNSFKHRGGRKLIRVKLRFSKKRIQRQRERCTAWLFPFAISRSPIIVRTKLDFFFR